MRPDDEWGDRIQLGDANCGAWRWVALYAGLIVVATTTVHAQVPPNASCTSAQTLAIGTPKAGTNVGVGLLTELPVCDDEGSFGHVVWYRVVGNGRRLHAKLDCLQYRDHQIRVYCAGCAQLFCAATQRFACEPNFEASWCSAAGEVYLIAVTATGPGAFNLRVDTDAEPCDGPMCRLNASCGSARPLTYGSHVSGSTESALAPTTVPACNEPSVQGYTVWYRVVGNGKTLRVHVGCQGSAQVRVFCGGCDHQYCAASLANACQSQAVRTWCSEPGVEYFVAVTTGSTRIPIVITVDDMGTECESTLDCTPPPNDSCAEAFPLTLGEPALGDSRGALQDGGSSMWMCDSVLVGGAGVWYKVIGDGTEFTVTLEEETFGQHEISVWCGACDGPYCISSDVPSWCSESGTDYYVLVLPVNGGGGEFSITVESDGLTCQVAATCSPPPNDTCASAMALAPGESLRGSTHTARFEVNYGDLCDHDFPFSPVDTWYNVIGDGTTFHASLCSMDGFSTDQQMELGCYGCNERTCSADGPVGGTCAAGDEIAWCTARGESYDLRVVGAGQVSYGAFEVSLSSDGIECGDPEQCIGSNDLCEDAILITPGELVRASTRGMTVDSAPFCYFHDCGPGMWYEIVGDGTIMEVSLCSPYLCNRLPLVVGIYCGGCELPACVEQTEVGHGLPRIPECEGVCRAAWRWCTRTGERYLLYVFDGDSCWSDDWREVYSLLVRPTGIPCLGASDCVYDPPPDNDACDDAIAISGEGTFAFDNTLATPNEIFGWCSYEYSRDVWFCWTSPCDGAVTVETCGGTTVDTQLTVLDDCNCDCGQLGDNEDACGYQSRVTFEAVAGQSYGIRVGTSLGLGVGGEGQFTISCAPGPSDFRPCKSDRQSYGLTYGDALNSTRGQFVVADEFARTYATAFESTICWWGGDFDGVAGCTRSSPDEFRVVYYADECGTPGAVLGGPFNQSDGSLSVLGPWNTYAKVGGIMPVLSYSATHAQIAVPDGEVVWLEISNSPSGECSWYWATSTWNGARAVQATDSWTDGTAFESAQLVQARMALAPEHHWESTDRSFAIPACYPPPDNDVCSVPTWIVADQTVSISTTGAATDGVEVVPYGGSAPLWEYENYFPLGDRQVHKDVWYMHRALCNATLEVDLCDADFNTKAALYAFDAGCGVGAQPVAISDNECGPELGVQTVLSANVRAGAPYRLRVGGYRGEFGSAAMTLNYAPPSRVSLREFADFARCFGVEPSTLCCSVQDYDMDNDVDVLDFSRFNLVLQGP